MTSGSPYRLLFLFTAPLLLGNVFQQLYNMVDSIVVGNFIGEDVYKRQAMYGVARCTTVSLTQPPPNETSCNTRFSVVRSVVKR